jgi:hypothetical protein
MINNINYNCFLNLHLFKSNVILQLENLENYIILILFIENEFAFKMSLISRMTWRSSAVLLLVLVFLADLSRSQQEIVLGTEYELQLHSSLDEILQEAAEAIHKLVPAVKYEGM